MRWRKMNVSCIESDTARMRSEKKRNIKRIPQDHESKIEQNGEEEREGKKTIKQSLERNLMAEA